MSRAPLVLLAGGKGTRLHAVTEDRIPKCMVEVRGKPFLYWLLKHYRNQGFTNIQVSVGHLAHVIKEYPWPEYVRPTGYIEDYPDVKGWKRIYLNHVWVANADTYFEEPLPETREATILSCRDIDAGAQYHPDCPSPIRIHPVTRFFDIGTPQGLQVFRFFADELLGNS